ncbi:hypothetical protein SAMN06265349_1063 [Flavobacterium resistens]|uniref:Uncharacterized protein n=1 Tax=Flavobacterium resistens TaxID=443612 RepID=A0A521EYV0_9FLAO|nr:hypothetical protein [Flavobacterium resistens]MRX69314.1 hypothetical protein [Flavobacterium resistens]SMO89202.1 hypothetical protein SAMN06265349_1063 [Flavobacterium resistens]
MKNLLYSLMLMQSFFTIAQTNQIAVSPNGKKVSFFPTQAPAWYLGGNTNGAAEAIGTKNNFDFPFSSKIDSGGLFGWQTMKLTTDGFLTFGSRKPETVLHIVDHLKNDAYDDISVETHSNTATPHLFLNRARGTKAAPETLAAGDRIGGVIFRGFDGSIEANSETPFVFSDLDNSGVLKAYGGIKSYYTGNSLSDLRFYTTNKEAARITDNGNVGVGSVNPGAKLEVNNGTTAGAVKIVDGTQSLGKVLTSDANGLAIWSEQAITTIVGTRPSTSIDFSAGNTENAIGGSINLPVGNWLVNIGLLVRAKTGESVKPNTCYTGRFTLSSSNTQNIQTGFSFIGNNLIFQTTSTGTKVPSNYPLFASGVIRVNITTPVTLYIWNAASSHTVYGCGEIGSIGNNGENYIYATRTQ